MPAKISLIGKTFEKLKVIADLPPHRTPKGKLVRYVLCQCECGKQTRVSADNLRNRHSLSCGCWRREQTTKQKTRHSHAKHGAQTPTYRSWYGMKNRCENVRSPKFYRYGKRGITVCERWQKFENFLADMGECPPRMSIHRIDNDGNYEPSNAKWAGPKEQARNQSTNRKLEFNGQTLTLAEWAEKFCLKPGTLWKRLKTGWGIEKALTTAPRPMKVSS